MKTKTVERRTVKVLALALVMALVLPLLPALPSFAAGSKVTSVTFKNVNLESFDIITQYGDYLSDFTEEDHTIDWSSRLTYQLQVSDSDYTIKPEIEETFSETSLRFGAVSNDSSSVTFSVSDQNNSKTYTSTNGNVVAVSLANFTGDVTVSLVQTYSVTYDRAANGEYSIDCPSLVASTEKLSFTVRPSADLPETTQVVVQVLNGDGEDVTTNFSKVDAPEKGVWGKGYTYTSDSPASSDYQVIVRVQAGYTVTYNCPTEQGHVTGPDVVARNSSLTFKVNPEPGYDIANVQYRYGSSATPTPASKKDEGEDNEYEIQNVSGNITVSVTFKLKTFTVTVEDNPNITVNAAGTARYGEVYTFTVSANNGYTINSVKYKVGSSGSSKDAQIVNGSYTIPSTEVTDNITITVTTSARKYNVTLPQNSSGFYQVEGASGEKDFNTTVSFSITVDPSCSKSVPTVRLTIGENTRDLPHSSSSGTRYDYSFTVTGEATVTVVASSVVKNTYTVQYHNDAGVTLPGSLPQSVQHGNSLTFRVTLGDDYDPTKVTVEGAEKFTKENEGQIVTITINSVESNLDLTIKAEKKQVKEESFKDKNTAEDVAKHYELVLPDDAPKFGEAFDVTVKPKPGYKVTAVQVSDSHNILTSLTATDTPASARVYRCVDGVHDENVQFVVTVEPVTVRITWVTAGQATQPAEVTFGADGYFDETIFKVTQEPKRTGFEFDKWEYSKNDAIGNEDVSITVTGKWTPTDELFTLTTGCTYDQNLGKLIFTTTVSVVGNADEEAHREFDGSNIKITGYGFLYGEYSSTLTGSGMNTGFTSSLKNAIASHKNTGDDGANVTSELSDNIDDGRVYLYSYGETVVPFTIDGGSGANKYTQKFGKVEPGTTRSGLAWISFTIADGDEMYCFGSPVQGQAQ